MYNCHRCGETSKPGEPAIRKVVETRAVEYKERPKAHRVRDRDKKDPGGEGTEIVKEMLVCEPCKKSLDDN